MKINVNFYKAFGDICGLYRIPLRQTWNASPWISHCLVFSVDAFVLSSRCANKCSVRDSSNEQRCSAFAAFKVYHTQQKWQCLSVWHSRFTASHWPRIYFCHLVLTLWNFMICIYGGLHIICFNSQAVGAGRLKFIPGLDFGHPCLKCSSF